jgi:hypothetical protein
VAALEEMPRRVIGAVEVSAGELVEREDWVGVQRVVGILRTGWAGAGEDPAGRVLDRLEDHLGGLCAEMRGTINEVWKTRKILLMRPACGRAWETFQTKVGPLAEWVAGLCAGDGARAERVRVAGAQYLVQVADACEAMSEYRQAERVLERALDFARGTALEPAVRNALEKLAPAARRERAGAGVTDVRPTSPGIPGGPTPAGEPEKKKEEAPWEDLWKPAAKRAPRRAGVSAGRGWWVLIVVAGGVIRACATHSPTSPPVERLVIPEIHFPKDDALWRELGRPATGPVEVERTGRMPLQYDPPR